MKRLIIALCIFALPYGAFAAEYTGYNARKITMFIIVKYPRYTQQEKQTPTLSALQAARERLRVYATHDKLLSQAYLLTVVSHTFDDVEWSIEFNAAFDTDVQAWLPSATDLLQAYFGVEQFFSTDPVLGSACWYTGFNLGDHGD